MATKDESETADETTTTRTKGKKGKKGKSNKAKAEKAESNGEGRAAMGVTLGEKLLPLLKKAGVKGQAVVFTKSLAAGETLKKTQLITLRDAINEAAGSVREDDGGLASQLSSANRTVRRLSRA